MRTRVAWLVAGLTAVFGVADVAVTASYRTIFSEQSVVEHGFPFLTGAVILTGLLGAVIVSRFDRHPIGWLLCLIGLTGSTATLGEAYNIWVLKADGPGPEPFAGAVGWVASLLSGQFAIGVIAVILLLAPDGRLPSPRWRVWVAAVVVGELLVAAGLSTADVSTFDIETTTLGPVGDAVVAVGFLLLMLGLCAGLASVVLRLRHSDGVRRQQLLLLAAGPALVLVGVLIMVVAADLNGGRATYATSVPLFTAFLLLPVLHTVAVLRYRLHDVEVIVNAAVLVAAGTLFAAAGYVAVVVAVRDQVEGRAGNWALSLAGTVLVALAFQPLRRWVVHLAQRLAHGPRARPYVALSDFSSRLAASPRPETLLPAVADAAGRAVAAQGARAVLEVPGAVRRTATWGQWEATTGATYDVPVRSGGDVLGRITVRVPEGRQVRPADARLLQALADQAATAFRNTALEARLADQVEELDRTTRQLHASRARLVDADDAARRALEAAISRDVLPRLLALPDRIARERRSLADGGAGLAGLVSDTNDALESLRDLTRGVFPTQLARVGLGPALRSLLGHAGLASVLRLDGSVAEQRFSDRVERAVYACCAEAMPAMTGASVVAARVVDGELRLELSGVDRRRIDVEAVEDRVGAVDGSVRAGGDGLVVTIPTGQPATSASAHAAVSRSGPNAALGT